MKQKIGLYDIVIAVVLGLWAIVITYPFYNALLTSIVPQEVYIKTPFMLYPSKITWDAYKFVFSSQSLMDGMQVTTIITFVGVAYNMILTTTMGYALTKPIFGQKVFKLIIVFTMFFGGGLIPYYLLISDLNLIDNIFSMILPVGVNVSYMIVIMTYFDELPKELEESAKIDGANDIVIMFRIMLPIAAPILATFALYYGVDRWNEWWNGMLFIKSSSKLPLQTVLRSIVQNSDSTLANVPDSAKKDTFTDGVKMASVFVTMLPIMCIYPFLQRFFVTGLTTGAVKG